VSPLWDAVRALAPTAERVYAPDEIPDLPTYPYLVLEVIAAEPDGYTLDATHGFRHVEIVVQSFGRTTTGASDYLEDRFLYSVLDARPVIAGWRAEQIRMQIPPVPTADRDDSGVYGLTATCTFTASKETP